MSSGTRWTEDELAAYEKRCGLPAPKLIAPTLKVKSPRASKYGAERAVVDGINFDSSLEARYYTQLKMEWRSIRHRQEREGNYWRHRDLLWFTRQVRFELEGGVGYFADFLECRFLDGSHNTMEIVDTKGELLQESKNKIKQVKARYGITVRILYDKDVMKVTL
jgi:hypothetical protein